MKLNIFLITISAIFFSACEDIFERNLEKEELTVLAPPDNFTTTKNSITFWWQEINGAEEYALQVVKGSFSYIEEIVLDSTVKKDKLTCTFDPGTYKWRIRAENSTSSTEWVTRTFTIDSTLDLTEQTVTLISPDDSTFTSSTSIIFVWEDMYNADEYHIQIAAGDFNNPANIIVDEVVQTNSYNAAFSAEGEYFWRVKAINNQTNTSTEYTVRYFVIDQTPPSAPILISPADGATDSLPVTLRWSADLNSRGDSVYIYRQDSISILGGYPNFTTDTAFIFNTTLADTAFFWRIKTVDAAGNSSPFSEMRKFFVQ